MLPLRYRIKHNQCPPEPPQQLRNMQNIVPTEGQTIALSTINARQNHHNSCNICHILSLFQNSEEKHAEHCPYRRPDYRIKHNQCPPEPPQQLTLRRNMQNIVPTEGQTIALSTINARRTTTTAVIFVTYCHCFRTLRRNMQNIVPTEGQTIALSTINARQNHHNSCNICHILSLFQNSEEKHAEHCPYRRPDYRIKHNQCPPEPPQQLTLRRNMQNIVPTEGQTIALSTINARQNHHNSCNICHILSLFQNSEEKHAEHCPYRRPDYRIKHNQCPPEPPQQLGQTIALSTINARQNHHNSCNICHILSLFQNSEEKHAEHCPYRRPDYRIKHNQCPPEPPTANSEEKHAEHCPYRRPDYRIKHNQCPPEPPQQLTLRRNMQNIVPTEGQTIALSTINARQNHHNSCNICHILSLFQNSEEKHAEHCPYRRPDYRIKHNQCPPEPPQQLTLRRNMQNIVPTEGQTIALSTINARQNHHNSCNICHILSLFQNSEEKHAEHCPYRRQTIALSTINARQNQQQL
ncbi:hypothetical protein J6590_011322 [Homalodisca vitripennis]|nr:hypothetical protein J6590_011322 [Homalodisca vitripennis]